MCRLSFSRMHLQSSCRRALCPDWRCSFLRGLCTFPVRCRNRTSCSLCQVADCFLQIRWSVSPPGLYPPTCLWLAVLWIPGCVLTAKTCLTGGFRQNESVCRSGRWRDHPAWEYSSRVSCFCIGIAACHCELAVSVVECFGPGRPHRLASTGRDVALAGRNGVGCSDAACIPGVAYHRRQVARFPACCVRRKALPYCPANEMLRCRHASLWTLS